MESKGSCDRLPNHAHIAHAEIDKLLPVPWRVYEIGDRTVRRAAKDLGIISRSKGGVTTWELPPD